MLVTFKCKPHRRAVTAIAACSIPTIVKTLNLLKNHEMPDVGRIDGSFIGYTAENINVPANKPIHKMYGANPTPYLSTLFCLSDFKSVGFENILYVLSSALTSFASFAPSAKDE